MFKYTYGGIIMNTSNITNYKPKDFAELIGVSVKTLQRWDREGILEANRTPTDRRYYTYDQYLQFKGIKTQNDIRQVVIYARVSTKNQKDDLENQVSFLRQFWLRHCGYFYIFQRLSHFRLQIQEFQKTVPYLARHISFPYCFTSFLSIFDKLIDCNFLFWQFGKYQQSHR